LLQAYKTLSIGKYFGFCRILHNLQSAAYRFF
jgi:hypothetical protein